MWIFFQIIWQLPGIWGKLYVAPLHHLPPKKKPQMEQTYIQKHYYFRIFYHVQLEERNEERKFFFSLCVRYLVFVPEIQFLLLAEAGLS